MHDGQETLPMATQALAALLLSTFIYYAPTIYRKIVNNIKLRSIPTVGCSGLLTSYFGAHRFLKDAKSIIQEGYDKYRGSIFKVSKMRQWIIFVSGLDKIHDIRLASDEYLSLNEAMNDVLHLDVSFGSDTLADPVHVDAIRNPLTRNIAARYDDVYDEIIAAFDDHIPVKDEEWVKVTAFSTIMEIVCRAGNRMLVGLPLCRNPEYLDLSKKIAIDIMAASRTLNKFPPLLKPIASRFTEVAGTIQRGMKYMGPYVKERLEQEEIYGKDWPDRPNDILTWMINVSNGKQRNLKDITSRLLLINLAAVHTTTRTLTNVLFDLVTYPEYVQPLREEIEEAIQQEGWSKAAMGKMNKLDSFVKESMRLGPSSVFGIMRKVLKDFTFSDGTIIPAGNTISVPAFCMHSDPDIYPNPDTFDGFRFEKMREKGGNKTKHRFVAIELDYLLFGQGRHACPGRFFAANELKTLLAHVLMNYDVRLANGGGRPQTIWYGGGAIHDPTAELLFRKRVDPDNVVEGHRP